MKSRLTGKINQMEIPLSPEEIEDGLNSGKLIQIAFPTLTSIQREFLFTGCTQEEWDRYMVDPEDDEEEL